MFKRTLSCLVHISCCILLSSVVFADSKPTADPVSHPDFYYINTSFENASPLYWEIDADLNIHVYLTYDLERNSTNRANGHWHFQIQGRQGSDLTFILHNFHNVWNGKRGIPVSKKSICFISPDGKDWDVIPTELVDKSLIKFTVHMEQENIYAARLEPYRVSDLERLKSKIKDNPLVGIETIGHTVEGRELEIIRVGDPNAPNSVLLRARAHPWEPGGNWVVQGLINRFLQDDEASRSYRKRFCVYIMPMSNKDGVARGWTRFNSLGMDLNRKWDKPADPKLSPENHALESWIRSMIDKGKRPDLAIDFHNDEGGNLHISRPNIALDQYLADMKRFEKLLYAKTWFTEGATGGNFHNPGSLGEGFLERFGINAIIQELNCNWIAGLKKEPFGKDWELFGEQLLEVFLNYFDEQ